MLDWWIQKFRVPSNVKIGTARFYYIHRFYVGDERINDSCKSNHLVAGVKKWLIVANCVRTKWTSTRSTNYFFFLLTFTPLIHAPDWCLSSRGRNCWRFDVSRKWNVRIWLKQPTNRGCSFTNVISLTICHSS